MSKTKKQEFVESLDQIEWRIFENMTMKYIQTYHQAGKKADYDEADRFAGEWIQSIRNYGLTGSKGIEKRKALKRRLDSVLQNKYVS